MNNVQVPNHGKPFEIHHKFWSVGVIFGLQHNNAWIQISLMFENSSSCILQVVMVPWAKANSPVPPTIAHSPSWFPMAIKLDPWNLSSVNTTLLQWNQPSYSILVLACRPCARATSFFAWAKTIIYAVVVNIGVTKHLRLLWICYIYLVIVWPTDDLVHIQCAIVLSSLELQGYRTTLWISHGRAAYVWASVVINVYHPVLERLNINCSSWCAA